MKITVFANYADPSKVPLYKTLYERSGHQLILAASEPMEAKFLEQGYPDLNQLEFVERIYECEDLLARAKQLASESDVLIYGHCPVEYFNLAVRSGKPVFRLSQHIYRDGNLKAVPLKWKVSYFVKHTLALWRKPVYLMCMGVYTAQDFSLTGSYRNKMFEFGEFTEIVEYDLEELMAFKHDSPVQITWINEFKDWYHPETAVQLAKQLEGLPCRIDLYGNGELQNSFQSTSEELHIHEMPTLKELKSILNHTDIFLMTGDCNEGWGSLLNQAMNHGCACVVSTRIGASKMIEQNINGLLYEYGNMDDLSRKVKKLMEDHELRDKLGRNAYHSMLKEWNGVNAGNRFYELMVALLEGKGSPFSSGLCAPAPILTKEDINRRAKG